MEFRVIILSIIFCVLSMKSQATHIMGGNIELRALSGKKNNYKITLKTYLDLAGTTDAESSHFISIRRKNDDEIIETIFLPLINTKKSIYENETCTEKRRLNTLLAYYEAEVLLDPLKYTDQNGYYLYWTNCCRNGAIINLEDPLNTSTVLRTFFPPLIKNGLPFLNSSPVFSDLDGAYICVGEPFRFPFDAADPDGDDLTYSLQNPAGYNSLSGLGPQWQPGYNASNAIPGNPALKINSTTGELYVVPNQLGLFVFSVTANEVRNGEIIGSVQRDYQFYVVDCPPTSPPDPTVRIDGEIATEVSLCSGKSVKLSSLRDDNWNYQWKKDGKNIAGANTNELTVSESGRFQLVTSLAGTCSKTSRSSIVTVIVTQSNFKLKTSGHPVICESGGRMTLYAIQNSDYTYKWFKNGILITEKSDSLIATSPGAYWAIVSNKANDCKSFSDTISVKKSPNPVLALTSQDAHTTICKGDSILLSSTQSHDYVYTWFKDDQPLRSSISTMYATLPGLYKVSARDLSGCHTTSNVISITLSAETTIQIDAVGPICGTDAPIVSLTATPGSGLFSGPGVNGTSFVPQKAGLGVHEITYTISGSASCTASSKTTIVVYPLPRADAGKDIYLQSGEAGAIGANFENNISYLWEPGSGLDNPEKANPVVTPFQDTEYVLTVTDLNGCTAQDHVMVRITHQLLIPDAFTPNGDGINDNWLLRGISSYPDAEVTIFNRWGNIVYYSKGYQNAFDGTAGEEPLATGAYPYLIRLDPQKSPISGSLILIR